MTPSPRATYTDRASVRLATRDDAEAMRTVYAPYVATPITFDVAEPSPDEFAARMAAVMPTYPCLVLEQGERVAGFAYAHAQAERAAYRWNAELSVYLEPAATGRGWGRALYDALLKLVRKQGFLIAYGLVTLPNGASERLHEALGFARFWTQPYAGWKNGSWHDVAWYVKTLGSFEETPTNPMPFDGLVRAHADFIRQVLAETNDAVASSARRA